MDDLRGAVEELRAIAKDLRKPSASFWQYAVIVVGLIGIGGGCVAYIDYRQREFETATTAKIDMMTLNLRQIMEMWKDDPKNFDKTGKQIEEIRDWIRTHR